MEKNADIDQFTNGLSQYKNLIFLNSNRRIKVNWAGFSQVKATLNLIEASKSTGEKFDRFVLLSGSDFPIKPLPEIKSHPDSEKEYIRVDRRITCHDRNAHCDNVSYYHFASSYFKTRIKRLPKIRRKVYDKISLYHGSAYWALTNKWMNYILYFFKKNNDYIAFHKYTRSPDEIFFNSILKSSPFAANIAHDFEKSTNFNYYLSLNEHGVYYINWNATGCTLPKVLNQMIFKNY
jgi:hypothetical protein